MTLFSIIFNASEEVRGWGLRVGGGRGGGEAGDDADFWEAVAEDERQLSPDLSSETLCPPPCESPPLVPDVS